MPDQPSEIISPIRLDSCPFSGIGFAHPCPVERCHFNMSAISKSESCAARVIAPDETVYDVLDYYNIEQHPLGVAIDSQVSSILNRAAAFRSTLNAVLSSPNNYCCECGHRLRYDGKSGKQLTAALSCSVVSTCNEREQFYDALPEDLTDVLSRQVFWECIVNGLEWVHSNAVIWNNARSLVSAWWLKEIERAIETPST
jgi:hypothetical protein